MNQPTASRALVASCLTALALTVSTHAVTIYVDDDAPPGGDGLTWATAHAHLRDALSFASDAGNAVTEIRIAQGVYRPDTSDANPGGSSDRAARFHVGFATPIVLAGGYAGIGAPDPDARDIDGFQTILSGDLAGDDESAFANRGDNSFHIIVASGAHGTTLDGVTISGGHADGGGNQRHGGGVVNIAGVLTIIDCTLHDNFADYFGAAIYNEFADAEIVGCSVRDNDVGEFGAAAVLNTGTVALVSECSFDNNTGSALNNWGLNSLGDVLVHGCTFTGNTARGAAAIDNVNTSPTIVNCTFIDNHVEWDGGAVRFQHFSPVGEPPGHLENCTFIGNSSDNYAGALFLAQGSVEVVGCTFQDNIAAGRGGGAVSINSWPQTFIDCAFISNSTSGYGGGIAIEGNATATMLNCTFTGNSADRGGAAIVEGGSATLDRCTFNDNQAARGGALATQTPWDLWVINCRFIENTASKRGGAAYVIRGAHNQPIATPVFNNCIFLGNESVEGGALYHNNSLPRIAHCTFVKNIAARGGGVFTGPSGTSYIRNCILRGNSGGAVRGQGKRIVRFSNISGGFPGSGNIDANPMFVDLASGDLRLQPGSPCIDAAKKSLAPPDVQDLDGDENTLEPWPQDFEGSPRSIDGDGDGTATPDMGAFEFQP